MSRFELTPEPTGLPIQPLHPRMVYRNSFVTVWDDRVRFADGQVGDHLRIIERDGRQGVAAWVTHGDQVALVRSYRYATSRWEWGVPRGFADEDDPLQTLRRELAEELGGSPLTIDEMGEITPNSGLLASTVKCFHVTWGQQPLSPADSEVERAAWVDVSQLSEAIAAGSVSDGFTLSAFTLARVRGVA